MYSFRPRGSLTALVTPFRGSGTNERAFGDLVEWQIVQGAEGLVPCDVIGEGPHCPTRSGAGWCRSR